MARIDSLLLVAAQDIADENGGVIAAGTVINRIAWDGKTGYSVPRGYILRPDKGEGTLRQAVEVPASLDIALQKGA